jgi:DNA gyrase/topoisomerase IV subunit A
MTNQPISSCVSLCSEEEDSKYSANLANSIVEDYIPSNNNNSVPSIPRTAIDHLYVLISWRNGWLFYLLDCAVSAVNKGYSQLTHIQPNSANNIDNTQLKTDLTKAIKQWNKERQTTLNEVKFIDTNNKNEPIQIEFSSITSPSNDSLICLERWVSSLFFRFDFTEFRSDLIKAVSQWKSERIERVNNINNYNRLCSERKEKEQLIEEKKELQEHLLDQLHSIQNKLQINATACAAEVKLLNLALQQKEEEIKLKEDQLLSMTQAQRQHSKAAAENIDSDTVKCIVCYENDREIAFKPCNHFSVCSSCANQLERCHICSQLIQTKERIWFN